MDENVIFNKPDVGQPQGQQSQPPPSPAEPAITPPQTAPTELPQSNGEAPLPKPPRSSSLMPFLKIGGIVLGVIIVLALVLRFVLPLFAGNDKPEKVTLTYWGLWEDKATMQPLLDDFHRQHPNITVNYIQKDIKQYRDSLVTQITNGNGPDIFRYHNSWVDALHPELAPLTIDAISPDDYKQTYFPVVQKDLVRNGGIYGIPMNMDSVTLFVNTELFQAAGVQVPHTWDDFVRIAKELTVKDADGKIKTAGAAMGTYDNITHAPDIAALLMAQNGTNFADFNSTLDNTSQALEFYTSFAKGDGSVWDSTLDPSIIAFAKGNLAMYFGYSWDVFTIQQLNKDLKFTTHPVPGLPGRSMTIASYWVDGVSIKSQHQKEAMQFMKYLSQRDTAQKFYQETAKVRSFGELYPRGDLAETLKNNLLIYPFVSQAQNAVSSYFVSDTYDDGLNEQMNGYLGNAIRSMQTDTSSDTAIKTLSEGVAQVLGKYGQ
jgi:ABC-type glycerol-3-phosphate transport system substrate-binding protein